MTARPPGSIPPSPPTPALDGAPLDPRERLMDLLVARATEGLSPHDAAEMNRLLSQHPDVDPDAFDHAAADALLAMVGDDDADVHLPPELRQRLLESCPLLAAPARPLSTTLPAAAAPPVVIGRVGPARRSIAPALGWAVAAGLALVAAAGWWNALRPPASAPGTFTPPLVAMDRFATSTPDAVRLALAGAAEGYEKAAGELVWSDREQTGYFRVDNLRPNDPSRDQYQLWIVDPARDNKPVDGGVFDITPGQNVVKIDAKLPVDRPAVFAITREKPGGVVVSAGPLLVVAKR